MLDYFIDRGDPVTDLQGLCTRPGPDLPTGTEHAERCRGEQDGRDYGHRRVMSGCSLEHRDSERRQEWN